MPVTKTAKRALRASERKRKVNKKMAGRLDMALRLAKQSQTAKAIREATSLADRAIKKGVIHANKAARIKSALAKLAPRRRAKKAPPKK